MRKIIILYTAALVAMLLVVSGCQGIVSTTEGPADDVVLAPGLGPVYRDNIQNAEVTLGTATDAARISYRDRIETKAGETRNNIFSVTLPNVNVGDAGASMKVDLQAFNPPTGITVVRGSDWHGSTPARQSKVILQMRVSRDVLPGQYAFNINVTINGKDYGGVPCTISVIQ